MEDISFHVSTVDQETMRHVKYEEMSRVGSRFLVLMGKVKGLRGSGSQLHVQESQQFCFVNLFFFSVSSVERCLNTIYIQATKKFKQFPG